MSYQLAGALIPTVSVSIAAEGTDFGTLGKLFFIALLIVAPFAIRPLKRIVGSSSQDLSGTSQTNTPPADERDLSFITAQIDQATEQLALSDVEFVDIDYPEDPYLDGRPVPKMLADQIVADYLKQAGLKGNFLTVEAPTLDQSESPQAGENHQTLRCSLPPGF